MGNRTIKHAKGTALLKEIPRSKQLISEDSTFIRHYKKTGSRIIDFPSFFIHIIRCLTWQEFLP